MFVEATVLIFLFSLMFILLWFFKHQVFSPWSITLLVWAVVLTMYVTIDHGLYDVTDQLIKGLVLWVVPFSLCSFTAFCLTPENKSPEWALCEKNVDILTLVTIVCVPYGFIKAIQNAMQLMSSEGLAFAIRQQALDKDEGLGPIKYMIYAAYTLLFIEANRPKIRVRRLILAIVFCLMFFFMTLGKNALFITLLSLLYLLYSNKKITLKPFFIFFAAFFVLGVVLQFFRGGTDDAINADLFLWFLSVYVVSPLQAFCTDIGNSSLVFGEYTFRPFYSVLNTFGLNVELAPMPDNYVYVPLPTNVYTILSPFFRDFGYTGIVIFSIVEGAIMGYLYKQAITGNTILKYIYAFVLTFIFLQFFDEQVFRSITQIGYFVIFILFCHIKFNFKRT